MSSGLAFFKRIGGLFRVHANGANGNGGARRTSADAPLAAGGSPLRPLRTTPVVDPVAHTAGRWSSLLPWRRRQRSVAQLRESYERVAELLSLIREHFDRQDQRSQQLGAAVERVAGALEQLTTQQQQQGAAISSIAVHVEGVNRTAAGLSAALTDLPAAMRASGDAVCGLTRQLEGAQQADVRLATALDRFGLAADGLRDTTASQSELLRRTHDSYGVQTDALRGFLRVQNRRFWMVAGVVMVCCAAACTATVMLLLRALPG